MHSDEVYNSKISNEVINFRVVESFLKKENRTFASTQTLRKFYQKRFAGGAYGYNRAIREEIVWECVR